jgi:hypothetical protein
MAEVSFGSIVASKPHQTIFSQLTPIYTRILVRVKDLFFALRAPALDFIREELHFGGAARALDIANLEVLVPTWTLGEHGIEFGTRSLASCPKLFGI